MNHFVDSYIKGGAIKQHQRQTEIDTFWGHHSRNQYNLFEVFVLLNGKAKTLEDWTSRRENQFDSHTENNSLCKSFELDMYCI